MHGKPPPTSDKSPDVGQEILGKPCLTQSLAVISVQTCTPQPVCGLTVPPDLAPRRSEETREEAGILPRSRPPRLERKVTEGRSALGRSPSRCPLSLSVERGSVDTRHLRVTVAGGRTGATHARQVARCLRTLALPQEPGSLPGSWFFQGTAPPPSPRRFASPALRSRTRLCRESLHHGSDSL